METDLNVSRRAFLGTGALATGGLAIEGHAGARARGCGGSIPALLHYGSGNLALGHLDPRVQRRGGAASR